MRCGSSHREKRKYEKAYHKLTFCIWYFIYTILKHICQENTAFFTPPIVKFIDLAK